MDKSCIISFGNSRKYRLELPENGCKRDLASLKETVKEYLAEKFPQLAAMKFYDKLTVAPLASSEAAEYARFEKFDDKSLKEIEATLSVEVEDAESLDKLNSNAPWAEV